MKIDIASLPDILPTGFPNFDNGFKLSDLAIIGIPHLRCFKSNLFSCCKFKITIEAEEKIKMRAVEQRRLRIRELESELNQLRKEELEYVHSENTVLILECRSLKNQNKPIEAMKFYRSKTGCTGGEARAAIEAM